MMTTLSRLTVMLVLLALGTTSTLAAAPAALQNSAQTGPVSADEITKLEARVEGLRAEVDQLRERDTARARALLTELDDLRDEVVYLRVKSKRESVSRTEYNDVQSRVDAFERRLRRQPETVRESSTVSRRPGEIPVGQEIDVRLQTRLSSETAQVEDRFEATTLVDLREGERVLVPAGSTLRGVVMAVERAGRFDRRASLTLSFDLLRIGERSYPIRATVTEALETGGYREDVGKIGAGAAVGAVIGGILGGFKGAMAGILIGGGGTIAATEGKELVLDVGTALRVRFDEPVQVEEEGR